MSFYRMLVATVAAAVIALPVFANDTNNGATPSDATSTVTTENQTTVTTEQIKVNINKASVKELMKVKGLNASKARSIVAYRKKHGDFKSTDDLKNVRGFKKMKSDSFKNITDQLVTE